MDKLTKSEINIYGGDLCGVIYQKKKARMAGKHTKGPKKRTADQDKSFEKSLRKLIDTLI